MICGHIYILNIFSLLLLFFYNIYCGSALWLTNKFHFLTCVIWCAIQPPLINLNCNKYPQEWHYYPPAVKLDRCVGSCDTMNDLPNKVCVPNKAEDLNLRVFNMITGVNESKTFTKHISCKYKCRFDGRKCNLKQWWNNNKC